MVAEICRSETSAFADAVDVRALRRGEQQAVATVFAGLSESSRRKRFLAAKPELRPDELAYLADVGGDHVAVVATVRSTGGAIGIGRYVRDCPRCDTAEVAFAVVDRWQGGGIGRTLARRLARDAARAGITRFRATMAAENRAAMATLKRIGCIERTALDGPALELTVLLGR
jgi:RimJ/RimL family protein N-acetyltransferase